MKHIITLIALCFLGNITKSQDLVISKDGNMYSVKIVHIDNNALYVYMQNDTTKSIRKLSLNVISNFDYKSRNNPIYRKEDSTLYSNYTKQVSFNMLETTPPAQPTIYDLKLTNPTQFYFTRARNQFLTSTACTIAALVVINLMAQNLDYPTNYADPNYMNDASIYLEKLKRLQNAQYVFLGASTAFTIAAAYSFTSGFIELGKSKSRQ